MNEKHFRRYHESPCSCGVSKSRRNSMAALALSAVALSFGVVRLASASDPEQYRPQFHITPPTGWMNDTSGLYHANGLYHLAYLWNPDYDPATGRWGENWAHLVSKELVEWTTWPISVVDDPVLGGGWGGSGLVDYDNTAGYKTGTNDVHVILYTHPGQAVNLSYSNDNGYTWTREPTNPVLPNPKEPNPDHRDPKVFWHTPTAKWIMVLCRGYKEPGNMFESSNLRDWSLISETPKGEIPDMFEMEVANQPGVKKWIYLSGTHPEVPIGTGDKYFLGDFDGTTFGNISPEYRFGGNTFGCQTFNQHPDGRRIFMGWKWLPLHMYGELGPWYGGVITIPVELTLHDIPGVGLRLKYDPVPELESMRGEHFSFGPQPIAAGNTLLSSQDIEDELLEIIAKFQLDTATEFGLQLRKGEEGACTVKYNTATQTLSFIPSVGANTISQSLAPEDGVITLHILLDRSVIDIFGNDGITWNFQFFKADPSSLGIELYATGGTVQLLSLDVWKLTAVPGGRLGSERT